MNAMENRKRKYQRQKRREFAILLLTVIGFGCLTVGICGLCWNGFNPVPTALVVIGLMCLEAVGFNAYIEKQEENRS